MANALITLELVMEGGLNPAALSNELILDGNSAHEGVRALSDLLQSVAGGINGGRVSVKLDTSSDYTDQPTATCTIDSTTNAIVADDTVTIGGVTLTWKVSPSGEDQVAFVNTTATDAAALEAAINAHSKLAGLVTAEAAAGVITLTWNTDPRAGQLIELSRAETNAGSVTFSAATLAPAAATLARVNGPITYVLGA